MKEFRNFEEIHVLADTFYGNVGRDDQLAAIFHNSVQDHCTEHLEKGGRFWQTVLNSDYTYYGRPFAPHAKLPLQAAHYEALYAHFEGEKAVETEWCARHMACKFEKKLYQYYLPLPLSIYKYLLV